MAYLERMSHCVPVFVMRQRGNRIPIDVKNLPLTKTICLPNRHMRPVIAKKGQTPILKCRDVSFRQTQSELPKHGSPNKTEESLCQRFRVPPLPQQLSQIEEIVFEITQ